MTIVVEDGTGLANADSYISLADADAYHAALGNAEWAATSTDGREVALRRATQYLDTRYQFAGEPLTTTQALAWPRTAATWPVSRLRAATCEAALRALAGPLYVDQADAPVTQETVGPISVSYGAGSNGGQSRLVVIDDMLRGLLAVSGRMTLRVERAS